MKSYFDLVINHVLLTRHYFFDFQLNPMDTITLNNLSFNQAKNEIQLFKL